MGFFTKPASQKKRKKTAPTSTSKKQKTSGSRTDGRPDKHGDDDISSSDDEGDKSAGRDAYEFEAEGSDSGADDETAADRRLRLAQRYLDNVKADVADETGFDAADIDRDLIAARLKEDTAAGKGKVYRFLAEGLDIGAATTTFFRTDGNAVFAVAGTGDQLFTGRKDGSLVKWELPAANSQSRRPIKRAHAKGRMVSKPGSSDRTTFVGHKAAILSVAVSSSGEFVATGGKDGRVVVWRTRTMKPVRMFEHHRGPVTGMAFKLELAAGQSRQVGANRTTASETLYSASADRSIKVWAIGRASSAYVETLFGHQDIVTGLDALFDDRCVSVGARDRTARVWKVSQETQLVFRAGGVGAIPKEERDRTGRDELRHEGSTDCIAAIDNELFVTGADSGAISLWSTGKKKPIFTVQAAHGSDRPPRPDEAFVETTLPDQSAVLARSVARGITAIKALPLSDLFVSGSWDGVVRAWRLRSDRKGFDALGPVGSTEAISDGVVNGLALFERPGRPGHEPVVVVAAVSKEHRLRRRIAIAGGPMEGKNGSVLFEIGRKS